MEFDWAPDRSVSAQAPQQKKPKVDVSAANGSSTVFVKNLPWSADEDTIAEFFADCGTVANVRIGEPPDSLSILSRSITVIITMKHPNSVWRVSCNCVSCLQVWIARQGSPGASRMYSLRALRALQQPLARMALSSWAATCSSTLLRRGHRAEPHLVVARREEEVSRQPASVTATGR